MFSDMGRSECSYYSQITRVVYVSDLIEHKARDLIDYYFGWVLSVDGVKRWGSDIS